MLIRSDRNYSGPECHTQFRRTISFRQLFFFLFCFFFLQKLFWPQSRTEKRNRMPVKKEQRGTWVDRGRGGQGGMGVGGYLFFMGEGAF